MAGTTGGVSGGAARSNAGARRSVSRVTTPSGPHAVHHATYTSHSRVPPVPVPTSVTQERSKSAGIRMPAGGRATVRTNPHVVSGLYRQNAILPARVYGVKGGAYRRMPSII